MENHTPKCKIHRGDIFDLTTEVLICSANVFLTLSGGVGGELLRRYGNPMQDRLKAALDQYPTAHVSRGTVVSVDPAGTPYKAILHTVCVDGMYESSESVIETTLVKAWRMVYERGLSSVALPALATGYGRLSREGFGSGLSAALRHPACPESVTVAIPDPHDARGIENQLGLFPSTTPQA